jgi:hypothetical protein
MLFIVVDSHSKWIEVHTVSTITSTGTIEKLRQSFASFGLPETIVSDNASVFTSQEFQKFTSRNGIDHIRVAPYHPASNGLAERAVQTVKAGLSKQESGSLDTRLSRLLLTYRVTPHATTGVSPAELLQGRKLRTQLDFLRPDLQARVSSRQQAQKEWHDRSAKTREFETGDRVRIRDVVEKKWIPATVTNQTGPCSYECELQDSRRVKRHVDHVIRAPRSSDDSQQSSQNQASQQPNPLQNQTQSPGTQNQSQRNTTQSPSQQLSSQTTALQQEKVEDSAAADSAPSSTLPQPVRRSSRSTQPIIRLGINYCKES